MSPVVEVLENEPFALDGTDVAFLQTRLGGYLERRESGWAVTRLVGHLWLPSRTLLKIRSPKASGASVLAWMAFVDPALRALRWTRTVPESAGPGDIASLAARLFALELARAIGAIGLRRRYSRIRLPTTTIRGRIDFAASARNGGALNRVVCELWERFPDTALNRFLAAALRAIARDPCLRGACEDHLSHFSALFAGILPRAAPELLSGQRALDRLEAPFEAACALARIVLSKTTLGERGSEAGTGFLVNLETLFERTVVRALSDANLDPIAKHPVAYLRRSPDGSSVRGTFELDAWCPDAPGAPLIVDAKYKLRVSASNIQQLVTYCFLTGARRGVFVIPAGHGADLRPIEVPAPSGDRIVIRTLELSTSATDVAGWRIAARELGHAIRASTPRVDTVQLPLSPLSDHAPIPPP